MTMEELKHLANVPEGNLCIVRKAALLEIIRAMRSLESIAHADVGRNTAAEATNMRETARKALWRFAEFA